jgi:hypothetical protein
MAQFYVPETTKRTDINYPLVGILRQLDNTNKVLIWRRRQGDLLYLVLKSNGIHNVQLFSFPNKISKAPAIGDWIQDNGVKVQNPHRKLTTLSNDFTAYLKESCAEILGEQDFARRSREFQDDVSVFPLSIIEMAKGSCHPEYPRWGRVTVSLAEATNQLITKPMRWHHDGGKSPLTLTAGEIERITRLLKLSYIDEEKLLNPAPHPVISGFQEIPDRYEISGVVTGTNFYGRKKELSDLINSIESGNNVAVIGLQRLGKTSLVTEAIRQISLKGKTTAIYVTINLNSIPIRRKKYAEFVGDFLTILLDAVNQAAGMGAQLVDLEREVGNFLKAYNRPVMVAKGLSKILGDLIKGLGAKTLVIFLDELQVLGDVDEQAGASQPMFDQFIRVLGEIAKGSRIKFIFGGRHKVFRYNELYDWQLLKLCANHNLRFLDKTSAAELLRDPMKGYLSWDDGAIDYLYGITGGHPYFLQYLGSQVVRLMNERRATRVVKEDAEQVTAAFFSSPAEKDRIRLLYTDFEADLRIVARLLKGMPKDVADWRSLHQLLRYMDQYQYKGKETRFAELLDELALVGILSMRSTGSDGKEFRLNIGLLGMVFPPDSGLASQSNAKEDMLANVVHHIEIGEETESIEFKGSLRTDLLRLFAGDGQKEITDRIKESFLKSVAGLLNSSGGAIALGVLETDKFKKALKNHPAELVLHKASILCGIELEWDKLGWDGYSRLIQDWILNHLGRDLVSLVDIQKHTVGGKLICLVLVRPATKWCYVNNSIFCVRAGAQTSVLTGRDADDYKRRHSDRS